METKRLRQWMKLIGYKFVEGREELLKGEISRNEANNIISRLYAEGAIKRGQ